MIIDILDKEYSKLLEMKSACERKINEFPKGSIISKKRKGSFYHYLVFRNDSKVVFQYVGMDKNKILGLQEKISQRKEIQKTLKEIKSDIKILSKYLGNNIIKEVTNKIKQAVNPEKIILFGSYAKGKQKKNSDLDILIIMNSDLPRYKRSVPIYKALAGIFIPKDIIVYTPDEVKEWSDVPQAFITTAIAEGKILYEKK
ncbi:MAG: nucleotidyltransferase domain-containing protein [Candidatus Humimicrobiaceae bacterium]